ncbi:hypothetical protein PSPO01_16025 [Paraphaeosphaeria sporulosa]
MDAHLAARRFYMARAPTHHIKVRRPRRPTVLPPSSLYSQHPLIS